MGPSCPLMCASPPIRASVESSQPPQPPINSHFQQENSLFTYTKKVHFPILYYNKSAFFLLKALACQNQSFVPPLLRVLSPLSVPPLVPPFPFFPFFFPLFPSYIIPQSFHILLIHCPSITLFPPSFHPHSNPILTLFPPSFYPHSNPILTLFPPSFYHPFPLILTPF